MTLSLYDVSVPSYLQTLAAVAHFMEKAKAGLDEAVIPDLRLAGDMQPFRFQIISIAHHSLGAVEGVLAGAFAPPRMNSAETFAELQAIIADAQAKLAAVDADALNARTDERVDFRLGSHTLPFRAADFILSFSKPNFYFHATTAYGLLRNQGVALGKRDYLGAFKLAT